MAIAGAGMTAGMMAWDGWVGGKPGRQSPKRHSSKRHSSKRHSHWEHGRWVLDSRQGSEEGAAGMSSTPSRGAAFTGETQAERHQLRSGVSGSSRRSRSPIEIESLGGVRCCVPLHVVPNPPTASTRTFSRTVAASAAGEPLTPEEDALVSTAQAEAQWEQDSFVSWSKPIPDDEMLNERSDDPGPSPSIRFNWQKTQWHRALGPPVWWQLFNNPAFTQEIKCQTLLEDGSLVNHCRSSTVILQRLIYSPMVCPHYVWIRMSGGL